MTIDQSASAPKTLAAAVKTSQVIRTALIMGILVTTGIMSVIASGKVDDDATVLLAIGVTASLATLIGSFVVPSMMTASANRTLNRDATRAVDTLDIDAPIPPELSPLVMKWVSAQIIVGALLEGGAVLNAVLWFMDGSIVHLALVALALVLLAVRFPSQTSLREWLSQ